MTASSSPNSLSPIFIPHPPGKLVRYERFPSQLIPARCVDVWLPPGCAARSPSAGSYRYPVLYMQDGQNLFLPGNSFGGEPWEVDRAILQLMDEGKFPGAIVVGVWNVGENRWGEYLPQKPAETLAGQAFMARFTDRLPGAKYADTYLEFLVSELKPFIDATYPTLPGLKHTIVMGSSMGGLISLYALTQHPLVFGGAGCISTHWTAGEELMVNFFADALPRPGSHKVYFDFGTETLDADYEPWQGRMDEKMRGLGYTFGQDWVTLKFPGAAHCEPDWRARVHIPLEFLFRGCCPESG